MTNKNNKRQNVKKWACTYYETPFSHYVPVFHIQCPFFGTVCILLKRINLRVKTYLS